MEYGGGRAVWWGGQAGKAGADLCGGEYQRPVHLAVSKPLQKNNKLGPLFDRRTFRKQDNNCMPGESGVRL